MSSTAATILIETEIKRPAVSAKRQAEARAKLMKDWLTPARAAAMLRELADGASSRHEREFHAGEFVGLVVDDVLGGPVSIWDRRAAVRIGTAMVARLVEDMAAGAE